MWSGTFGKWLSHEGSILLFGVIVCMLKSVSCIWLFKTTWTIQSMEFSKPEYWSGYPFPSPGDLPNPGNEPRSPSLHEDSLPAKPQGQPKNTGVGSLFLLQPIFLTQESNQGLLHCRRIMNNIWTPPLTGINQDPNRLISVQVKFYHPISLGQTWGKCFSVLIFWAFGITDRGKWASSVNIRDHTGCSGQQEWLVRQDLMTRTFDQ